MQLTSFVVFPVARQITAVGQSVADKANEADETNEADKVAVP